MNIVYAVAIGTLTSALMVVSPYQAAGQTQQGPQPQAGTERQAPADQRGSTASTPEQNDQGTPGTEQNNRNEAELPTTASPLALIALGGLTSLGAAAAVRRRRA